MTTAHGKHPPQGKQARAITRAGFVVDETGSSPVEQVLIAALVLAVTGLMVLAMKQ